MTEGQQKAAEILKKHGIDGLIVIGGDGSFRRCRNCQPLVLTPSVFRERSDWILPVRITRLVFDTAVNTAVEAIDKIKRRLCPMSAAVLLRVMGRNAEYIARGV